MITLGIDYAASEKKTACCVIDWDSGSVELLERPKSDEELVDLVSAASAAAIDIPLGWPDGFVEAVHSHRLFGRWTGEESRERLRFRLTDRRLIAAGSIPLSVSSDRIGVGAMRAAGLQTMLVERALSVDRAGVTGRSSRSTQRRRCAPGGFESRGYKGSSNRNQLRSLVDLFVLSCGSLTYVARQALADADDDDFDAFVCAILARASRRGQTRMPPIDDLEVARREGWIHLPTASVVEIIDG